MITCLSSLEKDTQYFSHEIVKQASLNHGKIYASTQKLPFLCRVISAHFTQCTQCTVHSAHSTHSAQCKHTGLQLHHAQCSQSIAIELVQLACTKLCSSPELGSRTPPPSFLPCYSCWCWFHRTLVVPPYLVQFHRTLMVPRCWFHRMNFDAVNSLLAVIVARAIESARDVQVIS